REWMWAGKHYTEDANFKTTVYGTELITHFDFSADRRSTFGVNAESNTFKVSEDEINVTDNLPVSSAYDAKRGNYAAFLQNEIKFGKVALTVGGRWDNPTDFASQFSAKGNLLWHIAPVTALRVSVGDSYRAPSLNDLNWPQDDSAEGNPNLLPEEGTSYEIGVKHTFNDSLSGGMNLFRQTLDNMIAWAPTGSMGPWGNRWRPSNLNKARINGLELSNTYQIKNITFNLNYTLLDAKQRNQELRDSGTNLMESETRKLSYVPSHKLDIGISVKHPAGIEKLFLDISGQYISDTYQYYAVYAAWPATKVSTDSKKLPGYWLVHLKLRKNIKDTTLFLGVDNLTNKEYAIQFGSSLDDRDYPMPGRSVSGGLEVKF
ncbi:MAG: TonB-dependent receptor, partial [Planctomycetota bacterium]